MINRNYMYAVDTDRIAFNNKMSIMNFVETIDFPFNKWAISCGV